MHRPSLQRSSLPTPLIGASSSLKCSRHLDGRRWIVVALLAFACACTGSAERRRSSCASVAAVDQSVQPRFFRHQLDGTTPGLFIAWNSWLGVVEIAPGVDPVSVPSRLRDAERSVERFLGSEAASEWALVAAHYARYFRHYRVLADVVVLQFHCVAWDAWFVGVMPDDGGACFARFEASESGVRHAAINGGGASFGVAGGTFGGASTIPDWR